MQFQSAINRLKNNIRSVPDFPKPGIEFRDITPILSDGQLFRLAVTIFVERYQRKRLDTVVGIDARGFIFGAAVAHYLGLGFVPVRKKGKLPYKTRGVDYDLEYGSNSVEMHEDALTKGQRVVIIDDLLATGGTAAAAVELVESFGAELVEVAFLIELAFLGGRAKLEGRPIFTAITF